MAATDFQSEFKCREVELKTTFCLIKSNFLTINVNEKCQREMFNDF